MHNEYYKKLKLIWRIILVATLLHFGWLLIELHHTKQSLAEEYRKIINEDVIDWSIKP